LHPAGTAPDELIEGVGVAILVIGDEQFHVGKTRDIARLGGTDI